jgi:hypothetical protein
VVAGCRRIGWERHARLATAIGAGFAVALSAPAVLGIASKARDTAPLLEGHTVSAADMTEYYRIPNIGYSRALATRHAAVVTGFGMLSRVTPPDATETPAGVATVDTGLGGEAPDDVPIIDGQNSNLFTSAEIVSYQTDADYKTVVSFYKDGMAKNGWTIDTNSSVEQETTTILYCTKDNRQATVTISPDTNAKTTTVLILIAAN